jgi:hypothetical protein
MSPEGSENDRLSCGDIQRRRDENGNSGVSGKPAQHLSVWLSVKMKTVTALS